MTEADILAELISPEQGGLPEEASRLILGLKFSQTAVDRINELAENNRLASITESELVLLDKYLRVGNFLNLIQAKARHSLDLVQAGVFLRT